MQSIPSALLSKLALAKEMYLVGLAQNRNNTRINKMLTILNYDFSAGTLIIAACIHSGSNTRTNKGRIKDWPLLIDELKTFYTNNSIIADITSLHELRNSIQHGDTIPSDWDIKRFGKTVRDFFDEVCAVVFNGIISYDFVSIATTLKSPHETELMLLAERYIDGGFYGLALHIIWNTMLYHYMLIRTNLSVPLLPRYEFYSSDRFTSGNPTQVDKDLMDLNVNLDTAINRLAMGEFYVRMQESLKDAKPHLSLRVAWEWTSKIQPPDGAALQDAEKARDLIYSIILGTEYLITEKMIVDSPLVYGLHVSSITVNYATVNYGILSKLDIESCELKVYCDRDLKEEERSLFIPKDKGFHEYKLSNLEADKSYWLRINVTQVGDPEFGGSKSIQMADTFFKTPTK